ncbi:hypothetical protein BDL97_01G050700 [Sphagnum fallax]|nr:hypothetical protein BDL97_01G050700 [Sphagnum fallax]
MVFVGLVFGFVVGVGLMTGLHYCMLHRSRKRIQKIAAIRLLNSIQQDELRKLCGSSFPTWVSFPTFEKVNWLNHNLAKVWPSVVLATEQLVKEALQPILEQYRPPGIQALKLDKFNIGTVPPKFDGIRVQSLRKSQIIMDMEFRWGGDASIILGINPVIGPKLPVQIKNLSLFTTVRVIFQLTEEMPCISAVVVALLSKPKPQIKYTLKVIGGSTGAIPGLSEMIDEMIESAVADQVQWPHRIVVPIGNAPPDVLSDLGLKLQGKLTVQVIKATNLKNLEMVGKSDPYVRLYVRVLFKEKTRVIDNNLNPVWNEQFEFDVEDQETQSLILDVKDEDIGTDKKLGITSIPLAGLKHDEEEEITKNLAVSLDRDRVKDKGDRGSITIKVLYHPYTKEEQDAAMEAEKKKLEEKERLKNAGIVGSTMDAVGSGVKLVGTGVGMVGSGLGAGASVVGSGVGIVGSGLGKAGKRLGRVVTRHASSNKLTSPATASPVSASPMHQQNGSFRASITQE